MLAYDYPLLGIFWSMMFFFFWAAWIFTVIWCFIDNFRRHDHSGGAGRPATDWRRIPPR